MSAYSEEARQIAEGLWPVAVGGRAQLQAALEPILATFAERVAAQARRAALEEAAKWHDREGARVREQHYPGWMNKSDIHADSAEHCRALAEAGQAEEPPKLIAHPFEPCKPTLKTERQAAKLGKFPEVCCWRPPGGAYRCGQPRAAHKEEPTP